MNHKQNFLDGFFNAFSAIATKREYETSRNGFARDRENLKRDFGAVARDIREATERHGQAKPARRPHEKLG